MSRNHHKREKKTMGDPNEILFTVAFQGHASAELGGGLPPEGVYDCLCSKVEVKTNNGRQTVWANLDITDGPSKGQTIFAYINIPKPGDKDGAEKFFKRALISFGLKPEMIDGLKSDAANPTPMKRSYFEGRKPTIWFHPGEGKDSGVKPEVQYIKPSEREAAHKGEITFKRMSDSNSSGNRGGARNTGTTTTTTTSTTVDLDGGNTSFAADPVNYGSNGVTTANGGGVAATDDLLG